MFVIYRLLNFLGIVKFNMKCPHCLQGFHAQWAEPSNLGRDTEYSFTAKECICPTCNKNIILFCKKNRLTHQENWSFMYPKAISRSPIPIEVEDEELKDRYNQACLVLADSSMASAALSRRCLQHILREKAGATGNDLSKEIDAVIATGKLPSDLEKNLDAVRHIGNFAAHPMKGTNTGEIIDVEPGEAEWNLEVVEQLMDFYYVVPARSLQKRIDLNAKLREAGKPELPL